MSKPDQSPFFIGWALPERTTWPFLAGVCAVVFALAFSVSYLIAATQDDPGNGGRTGRVNAVGILQATPYPIVHVTQSERFVAGTTVLLMGQGKNGAQNRADALDGKLVQISGARLARGDLEAVVLRGGRNGLSAAEGDAPMPTAEDLGRWEITGEICDGNCVSGAMRPGRGLAHKACAHLCIQGGLPPVFVATDKIAGSEFFLIGGPDGGPMPQALYDHVALLITAQGQVERRGGMNIFLIDPETVELAR